MGRKRLAWILLPAAIIIMVVVTVVLSSYQKEAGLVRPGKGGLAAVAAAAEAQSAASGAGAAAYDVFSKSLMAAKSEANNMAVTNPAEARLQTALINTLDCLTASREAWQAEVEGTWDPGVVGSASYWLTLHPSLLQQTQTGALSAAQVREWSNADAAGWLQKALDLVE
jgi:hypothetical protein